LDGARAGSGSALFVVGDSGLGKTRLLHAAAELATGVIGVGFGRGEVMEQVLPFGLLEQALSSLDRDAGLALAGGPPVAEPAVPYFRVLRWIEERWERPVLLALDDLHWADPDSLRMVAFLARRANRLPLGLIATMRPWPGDAEALCDGLARAGDAELERLEPLGLESVANLLVARSGVPLTPETSRLAWELCGGNPLLVEELAVGLARGERVPNLGGATPGFGEHLLLTRFAGMDREAWQLARAASVLGTRFHVDVAVELAGLDGGESGDAALDSLRHGGLIADDDAEWTRFVHPLFGQAVYEDIAASVRRRMHARAFNLLLARGLGAQAAGHATRGELDGDERAIKVLERTGRDALATGAVATAAENFGAAVRLSGEDAAATLVLGLGEALTANGRMDEAAIECRGLLSRNDLTWQERTAALCMLGRAEYLTGSPDHGEETLGEAVTIAAAHDPASAVQPLLDQSLSIWLEGGPRRALAVAARARELAAGAKEELRERAEATWGHLALETGDPAGLTATDPLARHLEHPHRASAFSLAELTWPWAAIYQFAMNANYSERYDDCERAFGLARAVAEEAGAANAFATLAIHLAALSTRRGRLEQALGEAIHAREFAELTPGVLAYAELVEAEALLWLGRMQDSEEVLSRAEQRASGHWFVQLWAAHVRGLRLLWAGDAAASDELLVAERLTRDVGIREPCNTLWAGHAIDAHLAADRPEHASRVLEWLEQCARPLVCRWPHIQVAIGHARLAWRAGEPDVAEQEFKRALELHEGRELPLSRIETLLAYGTFLRRNGRPADARVPIAEAARAAQSLGAGWLARTAADELRLAGGRRRRMVRDRDTLTDAERRVAELAADGDSNADIARRLYLSINTVQTHLKHAYAKLGINSRRQLMLLGREALRATNPRTPDNASLSFTTDGVAREEPDHHHSSGEQID
jgi:DNA-binding CsgD family transcriptional regulator